jgi:hypothetical protein
LGKVFHLLEADDGGALGNEGLVVARVVGMVVSVEDVFDREF